MKMFTTPLLGILMTSTLALANEVSGPEVTVAPAEISSTVESDASFPFVMAFPAYYDFGPVIGRRVTTITFSNRSPYPIPFFQTHCMGDLSVFGCMSNCYQLPPYGSCFVNVYFQSRAHDGMRKWITVRGTGSGAFAQSDVYGIDARPRRPRP